VDRTKFSLAGTTSGYYLRAVLEGKPVPPLLVVEGRATMQGHVENGFNSKVADLVVVSETG
jgi:hypothetical protein